jgi:hypothetical protein
MKAAVDLKMSPNDVNTVEKYICKVLESKTYYLKVVERK